MRCFDDDSSRGYAVLHGSTGAPEKKMMPPAGNDPVIPEFTGLDRYVVGASRRRRRLRNAKNLETSHFCDGNSPTPLTTPLTSEAVSSPCLRAPYIFIMHSFPTVLLLFASPWCSQAFQTPLPARPLPSSSLSSTSVRMADGVLGESSIITPDGFGFSAPARRILKESKRSDGYYRAVGKELVIDVMEAITQGTGPDAALVYDQDDQVQGIFTESDYIKVSLPCCHWTQPSQIHYLERGTTFALPEFGG